MEAYLNIDPQLKQFDWLKYRIVEHLDYKNIASYWLMLSLLQFVKKHYLIISLFFYIIYVTCQF